MRVWGAAVLALCLAGSVMAQTAEIPEAHLLLVDRNALRPVDAERDGARFEAIEKPIFRELMARHGANLILDSNLAPTHWSGLDVTAEAEAALHAAIPEWSPPSGAPASTAPAKASPVRMLFAEMGSSELSERKFYETLEHLAAGRGATLVVNKKAVVLGAPDFDITKLAQSTFETYQSSGTLPLVVGGPDLPMAHVAILNRTALVRDSAAGRSLQLQARALAARNMDYLRGEESTLGGLRNRLKAHLASLSPDKRAKALQDYSDAQKVLRAEARDRQDTFKVAVTTAQKKIEAAAGPAVLKVVADDHANTIVDSAAVVASDDALDITTSAVAKLDAALPHVDVTLEPVQKK
ncbi:MAG TPA: OmpH family outer membrane protein [Rhizomicrobium sp.]|nr:OmpH family outer membrane protein [Rhizomicrobium sp.]